MIWLCSWSIPTGTLLCPLRDMAGRTRCPREQLCACGNSVSCPILSQSFPGASPMVRKHDRDAAHLRVRLDGRLLRRLEQATQRNNTSMNGEIVDRLEKSFARDDLEKILADTLAIER